MKVSALLPVLGWKVVLRTYGNRADPAQSSKNNKSDQGQY